MSNVALQTVTEVPAPTASVMTPDVRELFDYDRKTGCLTWRVRKRNSIHIGDVAGSADAHGYICVMIDGRSHKAHRLIWLWLHGKWPTTQIDHINGNRSDNREANLRLADNFQNSANRLRQKNNTSGYKGVSLHRKTGKWQASVRLGGELKYLGLFASASEAHAAYVRATRQYHGAFANDGVTQ